jgi:prepilin-type processing-associated H-X9-DG protein
VVVVGALGGSGLGHLRREQAKLGCQDGLRQAHFALANYSSGHGGMLPPVTEQPPHNYAGAFIPILQESGQLPAGMPPCPIAVVVATPHAGGYAYSIGYRTPDGQLHGLRRVDGSDLWPVMADRPTPVSHGNGHNVLFLGGNVRFCTTSNVGVAGDDIFNNQRGEIAPGLHELDASLAAGHISPTP